MEKFIKYWKNLIALLNNTFVKILIYTQYYYITVDKTNYFNYVQILVLTRKMCYVNKILFEMGLWF